MLEESRGELRAPFLDFREIPEAVEHVTSIPCDFFLFLFFFGSRDFGLIVLYNKTRMKNLDD